MSLTISQIRGWNLSNLVQTAPELRSNSGLLADHATTVINQLDRASADWTGESATAAAVATKNRTQQLSEHSERWAAAATVLERAHQQISLLRDEVLATVDDFLLKTLFDFADNGTTTPKQSYLDSLDDPGSAYAVASSLSNKLRTLLATASIASQNYDWQVENALLGVNAQQRPFRPKIPAPNSPPLKSVHDRANRAGAGPENYNTKDVPFLEGPDLQIMRESIKGFLKASDLNLSEDMMRHYFANSGDPYNLNVNKLMSDVPAFRGHSERAAQFASERASSYMPPGYAGPVAFTTSYGEDVGNGYSQTYAVSRSANTDYWGALHNFDYATSGVTYTNENGARVTDHQVSVYDYYNFEPGTDIVPPLDFTDQRYINNYHLYGWAQNYDVYGTSGTQHGAY